MYYLEGNVFFTPETMEAISGEVFKCWSKWNQPRILYSAKKKKKKKKNPGRTKSFSGKGKGRKFTASRPLLNNSEWKLFGQKWNDTRGNIATSVMKEDSTHRYHQMVNIEIRLIIFFAAKDGEALYSQQKQDQELTMAQLLIEKFLLKNSD